MSQDNYGTHMLRRAALAAIGTTFLDVAFNGIEALADMPREKIKVGNLELEKYLPKETDAPGEYVDAANAGTPLIYIPKDMLEEKVTDNFRLKEFALIPQPARNRGTKLQTYSHGGKTYHQFIRLDPDLPGELQKLREEIDMPLSVLSPYRNVTYNKKCGGALKSRHKAGQAADLTCSDVTKLHDLAKKQFDDGGVGYYPKQNFVHVDTRGFKARWKG